MGQRHEAIKFQAPIPPQIRRPSRTQTCTCAQETCVTLISEETDIRALAFFLGIIRFIEAEYLVGVPHPIPPGGQR